MRHSRARRHHLWWLLMVAVNLSFAVRFPGLALGLAGFLAGALIIHIALHELGHAAVGRLVGFRVVSIVTGMGPRLLSMRLGRTLVELRPLPAAGYTELSARHPDDTMTGARLREFVVFAAGPATTLALTLWLGPLLPTDWALSLPTEEGFIAAAEAVPTSLTFGTVFVAIGWLLVLTNLVPWTAQNDGGRMLWLLRADDEALREFSSVRGAAETFHYVARGEMETALDVAGGASTNPAAIEAQALALCGVRRFAEARALLLQLVDSPRPDEHHVINANNLAWATINLDRADLLAPDLLAEADHWSARAMELAPTPMAAVLSTRGRVLLETGRPEAAIELLNECLDLLGPDRQHRAEVLAARALAHAGVGDALGTRRDADEAARLDADAPTVVRARETADRLSFDIVLANTHVDADGRRSLGDALTTVEGRAMVAGAARFATARGVNRERVAVQ